MAVALGGWNTTIALDNAGESWYNYGSKIGCRGYVMEFKCSKCGQVCKNRQGLGMHQLMAHNIPRPKPAGRAVVEEMVAKLQAELTRLKSELVEARQPPQTVALGHCRKCHKPLEFTMAQLAEMVDKGNWVHKTC